MMRLFYDALKMLRAVKLGSCDLPAVIEFMDSFSCLRLDDIIGLLPM